MDEKKLIKKAELDFIIDMFEYYTTRNYRAQSSAFDDFSYLVCQMLHSFGNGTVDMLIEKLQDYKLKFEWAKEEED